MNVRAVMISIQPQWCALIANGKKTLEVLLQMAIKFWISYRGFSSQERLTKWVSGIHSPLTV